MKPTLYIGLIINMMLFSACTHHVDVNFETIEITKHSNELTNDSTIRYEAEVVYLNPVSGPENLQLLIRQATEKWLKDEFSDQSLTLLHMDEFIKADMAAFIDWVQRETTPDEITARIFELYVQPDSMQYQNTEVLSLPYKSYRYEGGAHGMSSIYCINLDKKKAEEITYDKLIVDEADLLAIAEKHFREQRKMDKDEPLSKNYFFENDQFVLSQNFVFADNGLYFFYQPYEIAPYSEGVIKLFLPYKAVRKYIRY